MTRESGKSGKCGRRPHHGKVAASSLPAPIRRGLSHSAMPKLLALHKKTYGPAEVHGRHQIRESVFRPNKDSYAEQRPPLA
jgi:hypothetical protein